VLWCLNGQWEIKTSFRINPKTDFIEVFTHVWEDNIKMDPKEIRFERVDWIRVAQYRDQWRFLMNTEINFVLLTKN